MGSKYKSKSNKRKHEASDSANESEEERGHKVKKHKKEKKKEKEKDEKKLLKEAKKLLKQKMREEGDGKQEDPLLPENAEIEEISSDSYFQKNPEFTSWLRNERGIFFNDLPSAEARQLFDHFVYQWNSRRLKKRYYEGMTPADARRTQHRWEIKGKSVDEVKLGMTAALEEEQEAQGRAHDSEMAERRRWKADQKLLLDEMLPKATGSEQNLQNLCREAQIEKQMARREEARARESSPDITRLPGGGDVYGGDDSFAATKAREAQREMWKGRQRAQRNELADARLREAQAKEDDRMAQFRALAAKGPISIAKR